MHLVEPSPKFCITIAFNFSWDDCNIQEKLKAMVMQKSGGSLFENGEVKHLQGVFQYSRFNKSILLDTGTLELTETLLVSW